MLLKDILTGRMNMRKFLKLYQNFFDKTGKRIAPPYSHIVQVGDPILRYKALPVDPEEIYTEQFRKVLLRLRSVLLRYKSEGLAAPQIGVGKQVFVVHLTKDMIKNYGQHKLLNMEPIPFQVWINPEMKILDFKMDSFSEGCGSIQGYIAEVPRYRRVLLKGLDENGTEKTWDASGWSARIIQHEMDHLNGKLYLDAMLPKSFQCCSWELVNRNAGQVYITFTPVKWWTNLLHPPAK